MTMSLIPPLVVNVRVRPAEGKGFHIWLPLFLLWPLVAVVFVPVLVVSIVVDILRFLAGSRYYHYTVLLVRSTALLGSIRGTHAHVASSDRSLIDVDIY